MATVKLTDKAVTAAKPKPGQRIEIWDESTPGLCLRASNATDKPEGPFKRVWVWRYRTADGRQPRLTLGDYSARHGLKWAREEVEDLRVRVRKGEDPAGAKKKARAEAQAEPLKTFNDLAEAYLLACEKGHYKPRRKQKRTTTIEGERKILKRNVRPLLGDHRLEDISRTSVRKLLMDMIDRGIGAQTNKTHALIRQVFAYGIFRERLATNPAASIEKPATETPRTRVLDDPELLTLWSALQRYPPDLRLPAKDGEAKGAKLYVSRPMRIALQLAALLLLRRAEVAGMTRSELNLDQKTWLIPGERMKGGLPHLIPLPPRAIELIEEALSLSTAGKGEQPDPVFPSPRDPAKSIRPDSITHAMVGVCAALGIAPAAPHDLRRTASTNLTSERLGISPFIRSKLLAHRGDTGGGATVSSLHYDVNDYIAEKRRALEAWEGLLLEIVRERDSNVRQLPTRG
jgi:integrase